MKSISALLAALSLSAHADPLLIGTGGGGGSKGIYAADFDPATGKLSRVRLAAPATNPGFLALHPSQPFLYAVCRDTVAAYEITNGTELNLINEVPAGGSGPCHLAVSPGGNGLATANYGDGSISTFQLDPGGSLIAPARVERNSGKSVNPRRQEGPHAHGVYFKDDLLLVPDLGQDKILAYRFDAEDGLKPADPPFAKSTPGDGPRHLAFHPDGKHLFVINELSNTIDAFRLEGATLTATDRVSTLPDDFKDGTTAEIAVHPNGRWVFGSNRGHNSIAVFAFDPASGKLARKDIVPCGARIPRHFTLSPDGKWLLAGGQDSNDIHVMSFDPASGALKLTGEKIEVPSPICLIFPPQGD